MAALALGRVFHDDPDQASDKVPIAEPAAGTLVNWRGGQGTQVHKDEVHGQIQIQAALGSPRQTIRSPGQWHHRVGRGVLGAWVDAFS